MGDAKRSGGDPFEAHFALAAKEFAADSTGHEIPIELTCPITQTLMHDPVSTTEGNTYERAAIERCA